MATVSPNPRELPLPKSLRRTTTCYPVQREELILPCPAPLCATFIPSCFQQRRMGAWQVYLADNRSNQFSANLMHKGTCTQKEIRIELPPLSLMYFIIEFNAITGVPYTSRVTLSYKVVFIFSKIFPEYLR